MLFSLFFSFHGLFLSLASWSIESGMTPNDGSLESWEDLLSPPVSATQHFLTGLCGSLFLLFVIAVSPLAARYSTFDITVSTRSFSALPICFFRHSTFAICYFAVPRPPADRFLPICYRCSPSTARHLLFFFFNHFAVRYSLFFFLYSFPSRPHSN